MSVAAPIIKEACVETLDEAIHAQTNGAQQIELCSRLDLEGLTPSKELILSIQKKCAIQTKVMIRPREGNFVYSPKELQQMKNEILWCKKQGISEIVLGLLDEFGNIDFDNLKHLAKIAFPLEITFHKAFDLVAKPFEAMDFLKTIPNVKFILSSGQAATAWEGRDLLKKMNALGGNRLQIIVAGKVRPHNIDKLYAHIGARYYHGRGIV